MERPKNAFLIAGAAFSASAALLHLACIVFGGPLYRFVGAGKRMAKMADAGHWYPTVAATAIAFILSLWALYALSGARIIPRLPLLRTVLCVITAVYLVRGVAFQALVPRFPGNSQTFWIVSSAICLGFGVVHFLGLRQAWPYLSQKSNKAFEKSRS